MTQDVATIEDIREAYAGLLIQTGENTYEIANDEETAYRLFNAWLDEQKRQERERVLAIIQQRHDDLASCGKKDDCHLLAQGIYLALDDVAENAVTE